jgi:hypothetical protein
MRICGQRIEFYCGPLSDEQSIQGEHMHRDLMRWSGRVLGLMVWIACAQAEPLHNGPGKLFDLQAYVDQEVRAGRRRVVVPAGHYRVVPHNGHHLVLQNLKDVQLLADGVELVCTETTRALTISHCTNVSVRGLVIDYDPLPFTQGRITGFGADKRTAEVELFDGYPPAEAARNVGLEIFRPDKRVLRCPDRYVEKIEAVDARHLRITMPGEHSDSPQQIGDLIVIAAEHVPHGRVPHTVGGDHNVSVRLEEVRLFASDCFGFLEQGCHGTTYYRCRIDRRPATDDPVKRASPRLRSLDADAFHSIGAIRGPSYIECSARFMGDDCVNIHGQYHLIMSTAGTALRVLANGEMDVRSGDPVDLADYTGRRLPEAKAVAVQPSGSIQAEERAFLSLQQMDARLKAASNLLTKAYTVTLDREVNLPRGSVICSAHRVGNNFLVKACNFGFNPSRGIIIKASHGQVVDNHLEGCRMSAILVTPEYWWLEAGSSSDVQIVGNTIRSCEGVPICVQATGGKGEIAPVGAHSDITIIGNTVMDCAMPGILATSTMGLRIEMNVLDLHTTAGVVPDLMRQAGLKTLSPVVQIQCEPGLPMSD